MSIQPVFFVVNNERVRVHSIFSTEQEANCSVHGYHDEPLKTLHDKQHNLYFVAYENIAPPFEASVTMRVTADEVRAFNNTLTDDEVVAVLRGVEYDMKPDIGSIVHYIDEVIAERIPDTCDEQRTVIAELVRREKAGESLPRSEYIKALKIYKCRMKTLGYDHWEFYYVDDIVNSPLTALPEILSCFPPGTCSTQKRFAGALPDEVQP